MSAHAREAEERWVCGDAYLDILAAVVKQAIDDYRYRRNDKPHMPARDFLVTCGIVDPITGRLDSHGHMLPGLRPKRTSPTHAVPPKETA